jgi:nucleoside-diphosphate-sugar epimerase
LDIAKGNRPGHTYTEADWNPTTEEETLSNPYMGYFGSKTFAERAAWKFMETEKPNFTLTCFDPPTVLGPVIDGDLKALNTSHWFLLDILTGKHKDTAVPENISFYFVDVRDLAAAHVKAINTLGAFNDRFMLVKGTYTNREVVEIIRANFPEYRDQLPAAEAAGGDLPKDGLFEIDHSKRRGVFGDELISLQTCVVDMVNCFKQLGL